MMIMNLWCHVYLNQFGDAPYKAMGSLFILAIILNMQDGNGEIEMNTAWSNRKN